ncbi:MAG: type II and III secretion system protein [Bacteroidota bacterium]
MRKIILILHLFFAFSLCGQDRIDQIRMELETMLVENPGLEENIELSVNGVEVAEFIRAIGLNHKINLNVAQDVNGIVINNFSNARVLDVLVFLCKQFELEMESIGSIISFKKYVAPVQGKVLLLPDVEYNNVKDFLTLDLRMDTLDQVAKEISKQSFKNIVLAPNAKGTIVSTYIVNRPFDEVVEKLAYSNGLKLTRDGNNFYLLEKEELQDQNANATNNNRNNRNNRNNSNRSADQRSDNLSIQVNDGRITVDAKNAEIVDIIDEISHKLFKNYFVYDELAGKASFYLEDASYEQFLNFLLNGTEYTYKQDGKVYLIGKNETEVLKTTKLISLENRTIETVLESIPEDMKKGLQVNEFKDLNAFVVNGPYTNVQKLEDFIRMIDKVVPVIMIELLIVDYSKSRAVSSGISVGFGGPNAGQTTEGVILPDYNFNLSSNTINDLINSFNGFGLVNLGNVSNDFYASIQALETDGVIRTRSNPKLSTLNGKEANFTIGETEYYLEVRNDVVTSQSPTVSTQQLYKPVNANFSLTIVPVVSSNGQVTLEIGVQQSDFTERISDLAPPGSVTRDFQSTLRVKDGDMILLGGLEDKSIEKSGRGLPGIARVPIIRWFFGNRTHSKSKTKLNVFIRPTVLY